MGSEGRGLRDDPDEVSSQRDLSQVKSIVKVCVQDLGTLGVPRKRLGRGGLSDGDLPD